CAIVAHRGVPKRRPCHRHWRCFRLTFTIAHGPQFLGGAALEGDKFAGEFVNPIEHAGVKPRLQQHVLAVHISGLAKPLDECLEVLVSEILDAANPRKFFCRLLRTRRERPCRCAADELDECASFHSITSSASASSLSGTSRPSAFAVLRLMTSSNLVGCITGKSAGFAPLRIRPV